MSIRDWGDRLIALMRRPLPPPPAPPGPPLSVDKCAAWVEWGSWDAAAALAAAGIGPGPCRHWHVARSYNDHGSASYEGYWRNHWGDRHPHMQMPNPPTKEGYL